MYFAISAEANRRVQVNMDAGGKSGYWQQRAGKQNHLQILGKSIHAELRGLASSLLLFKTASGLSTLCRQTLYRIAF